MKRGEVWWADFPSQHQRHPVLLLSWDADFDFRDQVTVAQITSTRRGLDAEVALGREDGFRQACVANLDSVATIQRRLLVEKLTALSGAKMREVERAVHLALGMALPCRLE